MHTESGERENKNLDYEMQCAFACNYNNVLRGMQIWSKLCFPYVEFMSKFIELKKV